MRRLVLVDASVIIRKVGKRILTDLGYKVHEAEDASSALALCRVDVPEVLIVDSTLADATDLIRDIRALAGGNTIKIYYCLVEAKLKVMMQGKRAGADEFLMKPFDRELLTKTFGDPARSAA